MPLADAQKADNVFDIPKDSFVSTLEKADETLTVKSFDSKTIENDTIVKSVELTVTANAETCFIELSDEYLKNIKISDEFPCSGSVVLNRFGNDALQNSITHQRNFELVVKSADGSIVESTIASSVTFVKQSYFAKVEDNIVTQVIVAEKEFLSDKEGTWIETFTDNSARNKYAGIGYTYDPASDIFISPQPYQSWTLENGDWVPPVQYPSDGFFYMWDESKHNWVRVNAK